MKRFPLIVASGAIGLALLAGVTHELTAAPARALIPPSGSCYYYLYTCSYVDSGAYWSGCTPGYQPGMISTASAQMICTTYNAA